MNAPNNKVTIKKVLEEDLSIIKAFLEKYNITASDVDINKSYNLSYNVGLENCIKLNLKFKYGR